MTTPLIKQDKIDNVEEELDRKPAAVSRKRKADDAGTSEEAARQKGDDDVVVLSSPAAAAKSSQTSDNEDEDEEEVRILHETGPNALADFPHARQHCVVHPLLDKADAASAENHCNNCYCYVCDKPVAQCNTWKSHCLARSEDPHWRQLRQQRSQPHSVVRRSSHYSVKDLLQFATRIYPSEMEPPSSSFVTKLKHYQKQSVAFMTDVERNYPIKGGWLCSEVGMGKSAAVIALIINNPSPHHPTEEQIVDAFNTKIVFHVKGTVIFTSKSLMGQWEDEVKKHAPHLKVVRHYGKKEKIQQKELATTDVIMSTPTFEWSRVFQKRYIFHRVVLDESHLLGSNSARPSVANSLARVHSWCVTATPMISSVSDLDRQAEFLGLESELETAWSQSTLKAFMERYLLRHTKSQLIQGSAALSLPAATTVIKEVKMTEWERRTFQEGLEEKGQGILKSFGEQDTRIVEMRWYYKLMKPLACEDSSKIVQLQEDLRALLEKEPNTRAVVFTQWKDQHKFVCKAIKAMKLKTYRFDGSATATYRDKAIREFQSEGDRPAVFVITLQAGSVGITLTAASHVFLLEPCIDPSREFQAAGRIHRLGQTKPVTCTKYYFSNSCESKIIRLHQRVQAGTIEYTNGLLSGDAMDILRCRTRPAWMYEQIVW